MSSRLLGVVAGALTLTLSCSDKPSDPGGSASSTTQSLPDAGPAPAGQQGVECTHPGAGKPIGGDRCECPTTRNVGGEWATSRTCREGETCPTKDKQDTLVITQTGTTVRADRGDTYSITGTLCGDVFLWSGGPKDGLNPECGQTRFSDDNHYLTDSCFAASGECSRTYSQGCPSQKGQCTGTGAKKPEAAAAIKKVICN
jgi:hypothetical protein